MRIRHIPTLIRSKLLCRIYSVRYGNNVVIGRNVSLSRKGNIRLANGVSIGDRCDLHGHIQLADNVKLHRDVICRSFGGFISIGYGTTVNPFTCIYGAGGVQIGSHVSIATKVTIVAANHDTSSLDMNIKEQGSTMLGINIEDDVWIGANAVILDGVTLGKGSVVGAGAVVTKNVENYSVVGGVPAKVIGSRGKPA